MKRDYTIGNKINNWTIISDKVIINGKEKIKLVCNCGKEELFDIRYINRHNFSNSCRKCSQIKRHENDRLYNVGDIYIS